MRKVRGVGLIGVLVAIIAAGCSLRSSSPARPSEMTYGACSPSPCLRIKLNNIGTPPDGVPSSAASLIREQVERVVYQPLDEGDDDYSMDRVVSEAKSQFDDYLKISDAGQIAEWSLSRSATYLYSDAKLVSVVVTSEAYLGGAHGSSDVTFLVFDGQTGRRLELRDIVSDESLPVLLKASEAEFRRIRQIPNGQSLVDAGFDFAPDGVFKLPANFAVSGSGLHLHYNAYEVGPYVMGATDVVVPMEVLSAIARSDTPALQGVAGSKGALL